METLQMDKKKRLSKKADFYFCNNGIYNVKVFKGDEIPKVFVTRSFIYRHQKKKSQSLAALLA